MSFSSPDPTPQLAFVLPCYRPTTDWATNILESLARLRVHLPATDLHVYVVNDGAETDVCPADLALLRAALPHFTYLSYPVNQGKGYALRAGVAQVKEPYCLFTDIDCPYQEQSVAEVYKALVHSDCDIAVGVRNEAYYSHVPAARRRVSRLLRRVTRHALRLPVDDTQCGLKGFNSQGRALFLRTTTRRYLFDLELLFMAARTTQLRISPVTVELKPNVIFSSLNLRILLTESFNLLRIVGRARRSQLG